MRLGWGVRRYWWSLLLLPVLLAAAGGATWAWADWSPEYEAHALVVATAVNLRAAELPPLVEAVFEAGTVAESVVTSAGLTTEPQRLIPSRASAEPLGDGLATRITGRAADADTAALIANTAADALVAELTELGPAIASFRVHDRARPPLSASNERPGLAVHVGLGAVLGLVLALLLISVLLAIRRPLTHPQQVASLLELPVIGTAKLPRRWPPTAAGGRTSEIGSLASRLVADEDAVTLTAIHGQERVRSQLAMMLGQHLARVRPTRVISRDPEVTQAVASSRDTIGGSLTSRVRASSGQMGGDRVTIYDGDPEETIRGDVRTYLVLREGTTRSAAEFVAVDRPSRRLDGVIWVRAQPRPSGRRVLKQVAGPEPAQPPVTARGSTDEGRHGELGRRRPGQHEAR